MGITLKENAVNQIAKGTVILKANEPVSYICMVLKGRVNIYANGIKIIQGSGSFLGVFDCFMNRYICTYEALDDLTLYAFPATGVESVKAIINMNKDYHGIMVASLCKQISEFKKARDTISQCATEIFSFLVNCYDTYLEIAKSSHITAVPIPALISLEPFSSLIESDEKKLVYFSECAKIPLDAQKAYFSLVEDVTYSQVEDISGLIAGILMECMETSDYIKDAFSHLMNNGENNLYRNEVVLAFGLKKKEESTKEIMQLIDETLNQINEVEKVFEDNVGRVPSFSRTRIEQLYAALLTGTENPSAEFAEKEKSAQEAEAIKKDVKSLKNSLQQILTYGAIATEQEQKFRAAIEYLINAKDRMLIDDDMRRMKKEIASVYYVLYYHVFLKSKRNLELPKAIELFLDFGYVDERLLEEEQLYALCSIQPESSEGPCKIYTMREWLDKIYEGKKDTSKNEFDEDYVTTLRNDKKRGAITEEEEKALLSNNEKHLEFEILNMFATNNRLVNGQIYTFAPILYKEMFNHTIDKIKLTKHRLNVIVSKLLKIDYSVFYREIIYSRLEIRINREFIMKQVFPNIILVPTVGIQASMWQEASTKKKDTPARFLFPVFTDGNIDDMMVKMFGRYRWEICRNIQGGAWNNIKEKSLTSEYVDYIQFYRRNHDLSEDRKEKLKLQIQKGRNNTREIFLIDYEAWMKGESAGAMKLNKVVREIIATYCPFSEVIRKKISNQPIFEDAMARYKREKAKKVHELNLRYHALEKDGVVLPKELEDTMVFYRDM